MHSANDKEINLYDVTDRFLPWNTVRLYFCKAEFTFYVYQARNFITTTTTKILVFLHHPNPNRTYPK